MKKNSIAALLVLSAAGSASAWASNQPAGAADGDSEPRATTPYTYELGVSTHRETYEEFVDGAKFMQESALMTVLQSKASRAVGDTGGAVVLLNDVGFGQADYTGAYFGGHYGDLRTSHLSRILVDVAGLYTQTSPVWNGVTVGAGLGFRRLVDNLQQGGAGGYQRINDRFYLVLDLEQTVSFTNWAVTPALQYKQILSSKQWSGLMGGITVHQSKGYGAEFSVAVAQKVLPDGIVITPFLRVWNIGDSSVSQGIYEPSNKTKEAGVSLAYRFH